MLSRLMTTTQVNPFLLQDYEPATAVNTELVNVHYQENNYQKLLSHIQAGEDQGWILFLAPPGSQTHNSFKQQASIKVVC
ncbi:hypothetical protein [Psychromonas sp. GE-S-Ul-11]|uniref:hypothetical protein n=1 Tax=Psychromonas sp. GE-S-Ul-11 TaxID=3241170 RepID=UPI003AAD6F9D